MAMKRRNRAREAAAWSKRMRLLMEEADLGVDELAASLKAAKSTIYHWRAGTRIPSPGVQQDLAKELGVSVAELNGWAA
jgi:transcriptional regulator with XRE-family HTH domain